MTLNCKGRVQVIIDAWADGGAEHVPVEGGGGLQVGDGDSDVDELAEAPHRGWGRGRRGQRPQAARGSPTQTCDRPEHSSENNVKKHFRKGQIIRIRVNHTS